jgi:hypothetical protein
MIELVIILYSVLTIQCFLVWYVKFWKYLLLVCTACFADDVGNFAKKQDTTLDSQVWHNQNGNSIN